ncbi:hypothetical protein BN134_334 [Cronobacter dublinensis 1210]|uniref:Uncharacterized protein n=1 Tax=Cronobacter dublinensis 1210 TaxID=1208656 RepID=A0ABM9Q2L1_9ENTR|nr:hypothetical protein BN134_334 [Cronobacter dublinensis 1210]CCJ85789.1 hypothetical protein BN133_2166 [Cronobacter dublinensis 582]
MKILRAEIMIGGIGLPKLTLCQCYITRHTTREMFTPPGIYSMMVSYRQNIITHD